MIVFKMARDISSFLARQKEAGVQIGFVPTMGALHAGHLSLIEVAKEENNLTVCSIFVNPSQFNNPEDFERYPVTVEKDIEMLVKAGCDVLFLPPVAEIYPAGYVRKVYELGAIEKVLEGVYRPGHFQGVCQVVDRLLQIIDPQRLYLGEKDYQQCMVVRKLIELIGKQNEYQLITVPTVRENDGLAMSSRNLRLSEADRGKAPAIFQTLMYLKENLQKESFPSLSSKAADKLAQQGFEVDYVAIADALTLQPAKPDSQKIIGLIAASLNNIRLIDNLALN